MKIALGGDSAGKPLIDVIEAHLKSKAGHEVTNLSRPGFYADLSATIAKAVKAGKYERAILCCGTGIGVSISANKVPGIRAALCNDIYTARLSREHNDANVLALGGRIVAATMAEEILALWLETPFAGGRHQRRIDQIAAIEREPRVAGKT